MVRRKVVALVVALSVAGIAFADVSLPAIFGNGMVLQREINLPVWGKADPGEKVTVAIAGQKATATADKAGKWLVRLKPLKTGGPLEMTVQGKNTIKLTDILVGDVWVCSGQSNMAFQVRAAYNAQKDIASANFPKIRLFTVNRAVAQTPMDDCKGSWAHCTPQTVPGFSAVGFFFGREVHKRLGIPIGLIHTSWGGTPAEAWTERSFLEAHAETLPILARWKRVVERYSEEVKRHEARMAAWREAVKKAKAEGKRPPRPPRRPVGPNHPHYPSGLYNAMIAPLVPFGIKGAIWYQGESNASRAYQYRVLFPAMIQSWRKAWGQGDFPFLFVQLANFKAVDVQPRDDAWPELREAQTMTLSLPNTGMAVIIDIGEGRDIHPKNKQTVGYRLALAGLRVAYGQNIVHSGPLYESMSVEGNKVRIKFKNVGGGLVALPFKDPVTPHGPSLAKRFGRDIKGLRPQSEVLGFAIAGADKKFVWAKAKIEGDRIVVWSEKVAKPVAVRYAWENNPICNLYNKEELPASPFRTDDWPGVTINNR